MTLGIISTVRVQNWGAFQSWWRHHSRLGFKRFYLYMDPEDSAISKVERLAGVEVVVVDEAYRERLTHHPYAQQHAGQIYAKGSATTSPDALTALQLCNMATALDFARRDGVQWLLHIDIDELFYPGEGNATEHFQLLDALAIGQARYINHEAIPSREEHEDCFREITLFKRNGAEIPPNVFESVKPFWNKRGAYFLAYDNGKCAVRTIAGVTPATAHGFRLPVVPLGRATLSTPCILHYPFTSFELYRAKCARLGDFSREMLLGQAWNAPPFLVESRELVRSGDQEQMRRKYRRAVMLRDRKRILELLEKDVLIQIASPAKHLAET